MPLNSNRSEAARQAATSELESGSAGDGAAAGLPPAAATGGGGVATHSSLLCADRQRRQRALQAALGQAPSLQQLLERSQLLLDGPTSERVAARLLRVRSAGAGGAAAAAAASAGNEGAQLLLQAALRQHEELHAKGELAALATDTAALQVRAAALDKQEGLLRTRFARRRLSLSAAIEEDARLQGLSAAAIEEEVRGKAAEAATQARLLQRRPTRAWRGASAGSSSGGAAAAWRPQSAGGGSGSSADDDSGRSGDDDADAADATPAAAAAQQPAAGPGLQEMLRHMSAQRQRGERGGVALADVAAAAAAALPQQVEQLAGLRRAAVVTATRLHWRTRRRQTYAGDLALTPQQRNIRALARTILDELVAAAMRHVAMRPSRQQVAVELAEWHAARPAALAAISRHTADSILREVVDELLAEAAAEAAAAAAAADAFSCDMLVAAVAASQGRQQLAGGEDLAARAATGGDKQTAAALACPGGAGRAAREAALLQKAAAGRQAAASAAGAGAGAQAPPAAVAQMPRGDAASALYVAGLRGMLHEMRRRRPQGTPYGHTQHLTTQPRQGGAAISKAQRIALSRRRPPLAALPAVWARRRVAVGQLEPGGWPRAEHMAAAQRERVFWALVQLTPSMLKASAQRSRGAVAAAAGPLVHTSLTVPPGLGVITALAPSPAGMLLAAGTSRGGLLVWAMHGDGGPVELWFQVDPAPEPPHVRWQPLGAQLAPAPPDPAIAGLCWSADGYQLAALDAGGCLRVWWMRPGEPEDGAPMAPTLPASPEQALRISPASIMASGKAAVLDEGGGGGGEAGEQEAAAAAADDAAAARAQPRRGLGSRVGGWLGLGAGARSTGGSASAAACPSRPLFHTAFTITGTQPSILLPQATGDIVSVTTVLGGPVLPGLGRPSSGSSSSSSSSGAGACLPEPVVRFLMPPQQPSRDVTSQALLRCHDAAVIFLGFLPDAASLLSLDASGRLALWPCASDACGFGWLSPRRCWQLPRALRSCVARGGLVPVWPPLPGRSARGGDARRPGPPAGGTSSTAYDADAQADGADEPLLRGDPQGSFLIAGRVPWMVRYLTTGSSSSSSSGGGGGGGRVMREVLHRPPDGAAAGAGPGSACLVVSCYDAATGELLMRAKQRCAFARTPAKVVAADMTASRRELLLFCALPAAPDDPGARATISVSVVNLTTMAPAVPRIDAPDASGGGAPPAYALTPPLGATGSEYLLLALGAGVLGVFSLATGQLVRELATGLAGPRAGCLALLRVGGSGGAWGGCSGSRTLLAAVPAAGSAVCVVELGLEAAAQQHMQQRREQQQQPAGGGPTAAPAAGGQA